jgi:putative transposase
VKTPQAKSVLDAGWSAFRAMLRYKCDFAGATFAEVSEAFSTQTCSACDSRGGPKGIAGLGIRAWTCGDCGTVHDRNVNAAKNILQPYTKEGSCQTYGRPAGLTFEAFSSHSIQVRAFGPTPGCC